MALAPVGADEMEPEVPREPMLDAHIVRFLLDEGLAERRGDRICPTLRGFLMADRTAARIVQAL